MKEENQNSYTIQSDEAIGQVQIADEVVAIIAGLAATEEARWEALDEESVQIAHAKACGKIYHAPVF